MDELWRAYKHNNDQEARNELIMNYITLVKRVVGRLFPASRSYHDYDDLISCGVLGLIDAVDKFELEREVKFETYAQIRIRGSVIDYMRQQDWAPVHVRTKIKQVEQAGDELAQQLGRLPSELELANNLEMPLEQLQTILGEAHFLNVLHLDELLSDAVTEEYQFKTDPAFDRELENKEFQFILKEAIEQLSEREQIILNLYYFDELTLREIGAVLDLTESRISQLHSGIILKLKSMMKKVLPYS